MLIAIAPAPLAHALVPASASDAQLTVTVWLWADGPLPAVLATVVIDSPAAIEANCAAVIVTLWSWPLFEGARLVDAGGDVLRRDDEAVLARGRVVRADDGRTARDESELASLGVFT